MIRLPKYIALLISLVSISAFGSIEDDVKKVATLPNDTAKVDLLIEIARNYADSYLDSTYFYAEQAETLAEQLGYKRGLCHVKIVYGTEHFYKGEYVEAKTILQEALLEADKYNFPRLMVAGRLLLGNVYAKQQDYEKAVQIYREGLAICARTNNKGTASSLYTAIGIVHRQTGNLDSAEFYYNEVLKIQENELHDSTSLAGIYNNIGSIYFYRGDYATTEKYILKALEINRAINNVRFEIINLANLGAIWGEPNGNLIKSMDYFNQAIELSKKRGEKETLYNFYQNMADINYNHQHYKEAFDYLALSNVYRDSVWGDNTRAQLNELEQDYKVKATQDSLRLKEQDLDIALANEEAANEKAAKTIWQLVGAIGLAVLVLVVLAFVYRNAKKQKRMNLILTEKNEEINHQKLIIEEKNTELTDSITYAKRIQAALLPSDDAMNEMLGKHFLLFRPKDIVSGDFYWVRKFEGKTYFSVADCTGHGVPGAMVSMLGYDTLEKVVLQTPASSAEFLTEVNKELIAALSSQGKVDKEQVKDGMDVGFATLTDLSLPDRQTGKSNESGDDNNTPSKILDFSGANNGCYIIRSKEHDFPEESDNVVILKGASHSLIEIKPNKRPVGFHHNDSTFDSHLIDLIPGDRLILYSDGYADQFGGEKGKKMKSSNFKDQLLKNAGKDISELHQHLEKFLDDWMGTFDQLDDITVMGIEIE